MTEPPLPHLTGEKDVVKGAAIPINVLPLWVRTVIYVYSISLALYMGLFRSGKPVSANIILGLSITILFGIFLRLLIHLSKKREENAG